MGVEANIPENPRSGRKPKPQDQPPTRNLSCDDVSDNNRGLRNARLMSYGESYTNTFHSPGLEPWICGIVEKSRPISVLDVGCGLGFWGFILKGLQLVPHVVGVDIDPVKVEFAKKLGVYDELYVSDIRTFSYFKRFDATIAVEALHGILDVELLRRLEALTERSGVIVLSLPYLPRSITVNELIGMGYVVYRYILRGFFLVRVDRAEVHVRPSRLRLWRVLGLVTRLLHPMLKLLGVLERGYLLAYKVV
jgi:SAM-dependent methyltransferase